jgi:heme exporter protein D
MGSHHSSGGHMIWESWSQFWDMGGYGLYVWGSMGVTAACMGIEVWQARLAHKQLLSQLRAEHEGSL